MKANELVKKHGFQYSRNLIRDYPNHTHVTNDGRMFINENMCAPHIKVQLSELVKIDDLKRLVESYELVQSYSSLKDAKKALSKKSILRWINPETELLRQAIADVESCQ